MIFSYDKTYDFMGKRSLFLGISAVFVLLSFVLMFAKGPNFGIDFLGGTVMQVKYANEAPIAEIRKALDDGNFKDSSIKEFGSKDEIIIRLSATGNDLGSNPESGIRSVLKNTGDFEVRRVDIVGAKVGAELQQKGISAVLLALVGVLIYISLRFEWRFAIVAIIALLHDIVITIGAIVLFDITANLEILAALLTILGYSLNDTIIVFDRIREELSFVRFNTLSEVVNYAVSRTLSRTTLTSLTVFFVVFVLYLFGGELINGLSLTIIVGVIVGTYSSIFVAANLLGIFGFDVAAYRAKELKKLEQKKKKAQMRAQFEQGIL